MGYQLREIETKLQCHDYTLTEIESLLRMYSAKEQTGFLAGTGTDYYWGIPRKSSAFYRVRERDGIRQLTYKEEDRGNSQDRFEGDLSCVSPLSDCIAIANKQYGEMRGTIFKFFYVHFFNDSKWDTICCYSVKVDGVEQEVVYVEVEGRDPEWIQDQVESLMNLIPGLEPAPGSLWSMYFK